MSACHPLLQAGRRFSRYIILLLIPFSLCYSGQEAKGQGILRECIASAGSSSHGNELYVSQTIGQCYSTLPFHSADLTVQAGFQQSKLSWANESNVRENFLIDLFPNPASGSVTVSSSEVLPIAVVEVFEMTGRELFRQDIADFSSSTIDCSEWPSGIYSLKVTDSGLRSFCIRLIITK